MSDICSFKKKLENLWKQSSANLIILENQIRETQMRNNNFVPPELHNKYLQYFEYNKSACTNYYKYEEYEEYIRQEAIRQEESLRQAEAVRQEAVRQEAVRQAKLIEEANKKAEQDKLSEKLNSILITKQNEKKSKYEQYLLEYEANSRKKLAETQHIVDAYKTDVEIITDQIQRAAKWY